MKIPKQINVKTALIFLVISILLTSAFFYAFAATPSSTFYISSGVYPGAPSYTIWKEGSNYFAKDANGQLKYSGTNASQIITNCIANNVHIKIKQDFVGNIWITNTIVIPSGTKYVTFEGDGNVEAVGVLGGLKLADGANCDMFAVEAGCHQIKWINLGMHGNKDGQTSSCHGIHFSGAASASSDCRIERCSIIAFETHCIYVETSLTASWIVDNFLEDSGGNAIEADGLINSIIENNILWSCAYGIRVYSTSYASQDLVISNNLFSHMTSSAIYLFNSTNNVVDGNWMTDSSKGVSLQDTYRTVIDSNNIKWMNTEGICINHSQYITISDNVIIGASIATDNGYPGLFIGKTGAGSHYCIISGNIISSIDCGNQTSFGINEEAGSDNNIFSHCYCTGSDQQNITITGTSSYVVNSYNGTAWIDEYSPS